MTTVDDDEQRRRSALGKAIRLRRVELDLSRADLAGAAEVSYTYVSEIENGTKQASSKTLWRIARALGLEPHELLAAAAQWETRPPTPEPAQERLAVPEGSPEPASRWFHAGRAPATTRSRRAESRGEDPPGPTLRPPELVEVLDRLAVALDGVPDERAELALMLTLDERRTRRIVREELGRHRQV